MADTILNIQLQFRNDTEANWIAVQDVIVPLVGEPCYTTDGVNAGRIKYGDGASTWGQLEYSGNNLSGDNKTIAINNNVISILGASTANAGAHIVINSDGEIEWEIPADYATSEELSDLATIVGTNSTSIGTIMSSINNMYTKEEVDNIVDKIYRYKGSVDTFDDLLATIGVSYTPVVGDVWNIATSGGTDTNGHPIQSGDNIACSSDVVGSVTWDLLSGFVDLSGYDTSDEVDSKLISKVDKVDGYSLVNNNLIAILTTVQSGAQVNVIDTVSNEFTVVDKNLSISEISQTKITGLETTLLGKVNAITGYSLVSDNLITKLTNLPVITAISNEFIITDGTLEIEEISSDKVTGLSDALEKLDSIDSDAQTNIIEIIKMNGTALSIVDKIVDIPIATSDRLGVVKSSTDENKIFVNEDGTMEVGMISANKLVQDEGTTLILNGGDSSV